MLKYNGLSLKTKIMLLLTLVPLMTLSAYLYLVINIFEQDKIAYVFDSTSNVSRSISAQVKNQFISVITSLKPAFKEYITSGSPGGITQEILNSNKEILSLTFFKYENNNYNLDKQIEQNDFIQKDWSKTNPELVTWLVEADLRQRIVKNIFNNNSLVLFEKIAPENGSFKFIVAIVYKNLNLVSTFQNPSQLKIYLNNDVGDILLGIPIDDSKNLSGLLNKNYFSELKKKNGNDGTEIITGSNKISYLTSFSKTGFSDLTVTTLIDKKHALSAIKTLLRKSVLFFGFLLTITVLISMFSSQSLTKAIQDLFEGTQKIANGDFNFRLKIKSNDEVGGLVEGFNLMSTEISRLMKETAEKARMTAELQTAKTVQETLFPQAYSDFETIKLAGFYEPASECGGDWWYYFKVENKVFVCIGDATGHGAPAALITSAARSASSVIENFQLTAKEYVRLLNKSIYDVSKGKVMMTFFLGVLDLKDLTFSYCNASHEPPFLITKKSGPPKRKDLKLLFDVNNPRLGENKDTQYKEATIQLMPGDSIFFYTDGISDIKNKNNEYFGERNLIKTLVDIMKDYPNALTAIERYKEIILSYRQNSLLEDDVTFFMLECKDKNS